MKKYLFFLLLTIVNLCAMERTPNQMFLDEIDDLIEEFQKGKDRSFSLLTECIKHDADIVNAQDERGNTALHRAVWHNDTELMGYLHTWEPNHFIKNKQHQTPLLMAAYLINIDTKYDDNDNTSSAIHTLISYESSIASVDERDKNYNTALDLLDPTKHQEIIKALLHVKAKQNTGAKKGVLIGTHYCP